ncbi:M6 family metalloprotease domain-containing protein [Streptomyces sp. NPDC002992]|uniref:M6 family metalloprotease domain-containing protein n=1 Tax=Streptomyces sp. NPDC002992 TaxID=3154273 RepID=UPI0033B63427
MPALPTAGLRCLTATLALASCLAAPTAATAAPPAADRPQAPAPAADCALPGRTGWTDEGHATDRVQFQPSTGTRRVLMLFVDFPDAPATDSTDDYAAHLAPAAEWMNQASYGRLQLDITPVHRWIRMPAASTSYDYARGLTFEAHERYLRDAVTAADPQVDFAGYDMVHVVANKAAKAIPFSPTYLYDPATSGVTADGNRVKWAVTFGQDMWRWGHKVVAHETGHTFGLPDLYSFNAPTHGFVGGWDVMGNIAGHAPQFLGWHSWKLGWTRDDQVTCLPGSGHRTVLLNPVERPGGTKIAVVRTGETTAYVAESRHAEGNDENACSTGVLIYKVDSAAHTGNGPVRVMNANPTTTPPQGCTQLDMAAYAPGQAFTDPDTGVRIEILASNRAGDVVRIGKP